MRIRSSYYRRRAAYALWRVVRVLWVCRLPVLSATAGGAIFLFTAQGRDLFADLGLTREQWLYFFAFVVLWALIIHAVARRALQNDDWVPEAHCPPGLKPNRRRCLQHRFRISALWIPRLLGISVFIVLAAAIYDARANLDSASRGLAEAADAVRLADRLLLVTGFCTFVYLLTWARRPVMRLFRRRAPALVCEPPLLIGLVPFPRSLHPRHWRFGPGLGPKLFAVSRGFLLLAAAVISVTFAIAVVEPHAIAETLPRAMLVPLLFAGAVVLLGEMVLWSHRRRFPQLLLLAVVSMLLLNTVTRFHDVRWIERGTTARNPTGESSQISMVEAVRRWRAANECGGEYQDRPCPRPIIVAGAGGASRAAFLTASVVGGLIDLGRERLPSGEYRVSQDYGNVRNRIFALSTVSGSSVGAVVTRAALADALEHGTPDTPPCHRQTDQRAWFRSISSAGAAFSGPADITNSWRDCLQLLLTGDFLSPVVVGLFYRDNFPIPNPLDDWKPLWDDRAALLEEGFERRYREVTELDGDRACGASENRGLCRRFGYHPDPMAARGAWLPLLFVNGTSVSTGRRIIVSDVPASDVYAREADGSEHMLFPQAYGLEEIRSWITKGGIADDRQKPDAIRLSTAATMSARFPVISPHGNLRDRTGRLVDRIVDGGYFENDGLATAADIVAALKQLGLSPVVIRVVNEPEKPEDLKFQLGKNRPAVPDENERSPFDGFTSIFRALTATRSGHEDGHEAYLKGTLSGAEVSGEDRLYEVRVYSLRMAKDVPTQRSDLAVSAPLESPLCRRTITNKASMSFVSMSWWMSHPVQAYLDAQLCVRANWVRLQCELREGKVANGKACPHDASRGEIASAVP